MPTMPRFPGIAVLSVCLIGSSWSDTVFAATETATSSSPSSVSASATQTHPFNPVSHLAVGDETRRAMAAPLDQTETTGSPVLAQRGRYRGGRRGGHNSAASAEMVLGAVGMIAGAAVLTYANRPECSANHLANGCDYGTKVLGTSVAAAGVVSFLAGALTWR
jgi:hypothetical protein